MKVKVSVSIDKFEYERAQKNGLNTSQICTNALKACNDAIEAVIGKQPVFSEGFCAQKSSAGGEGFEPSTPNLGGWCSIRTEHRERVYLGPLYSPQFPVQQLTKNIGCNNPNVCITSDSQQDKRFCR